MLIKLKKALQLIGVIVIGILLVAVVVGFARDTSESVRAAGPIPPPVGYPKLSLSTKVVNPPLSDPDGAVLTYTIEVVNTGAYTASDVILADAIPNHTIYNNDAQSSAPPDPIVTDGVLVWAHGQVGFDASELITFSVTVDDGYEGVITNTAVISDPMIAEPVIVDTESRITDHPFFEISKSATPTKPGANQPLTYELVVTNNGQSAVNIPITVTDFVPANTSFLNADPDGSFADGVVTWNRNVDLEFGDTSTFTFSVTIADVPSGTVINNDNYLVIGPEDIGAGEPYSTTVIDPILILSKSIYPDPPGSNSEVTYTLTVLNLGSKATDLVINDTVPQELTYLRGGDFSNGVVSWYLPSLETRESAQVTFTVFVDDIAGITVWNDDYSICTENGLGVCAQGIPVPSLLVGPTFEATATLDPIAKGTGGGTKPVTPTLVIENLGPGNALDATALIHFGRISIHLDDLVPPAIGTLVDGPACEQQYPSCSNYLWTGSLAMGEVVTFTTYVGQSTTGGGEGTHYTATVVVSDTLGDYVTEPVTDTAIGHITHFANLIPTKSAPPTIGPGQTMTYTIQVFDSAYTTEMEPPPVLTETVPSSVTLQSISDDGSSEVVGGETVITWVLPAMGPGDILNRSFSVQVDEDLVSGTLIVNDDYRTTWYENEVTGTMTNLGEPVTTTVREIGLIDSYKTVTPTWALPGEGTVLTYVVHVVNSGPYDLSGVQLEDIFPWEHTTFQRDAVATSGVLSSDIVSLAWTGNVPAYSEELITFTAVVDDFFEGVVTNTATIAHESLREDKVVEAVAYITDDPVLRISKKATPDPVTLYGTLFYQLQVENLGQQATLLVITDTLPANTAYVLNSASSGGQVADGVVTWNFPVLNPGEKLNLSFKVTVLGGNEVVNASYAVRCDEGAYAYGKPVVTRVFYPGRRQLLPVIFKY